MMTANDGLPNGAASWGYLMGLPVKMRGLAGLFGIDWIF